MCCVRLNLGINFFFLKRVSSLERRKKENRRRINYETFFNRSRVKTTNDVVIRSTAAAVRFTSDERAIQQSSFECAAARTFYISALMSTHV